MKPVKVITLPNGRACTIRTYVAGWKQVKTAPHNGYVAGWGHFPTLASDIHRDMLAGMHDRINRHLPWYGKGRKWDQGWQRDTWRASRDLNTPRLAIHWLPHWLKARFGHRLSSL